MQRYTDYRIIYTVCFSLISAIIFALGLKIGTLITKPVEQKVSEPIIIYIYQISVEAPKEQEPTIGQEISRDFDIFQSSGYTYEELSYALSDENYKTMQPYLGSILKAEDTYGVNAFYLMCKLGLESGWGKYTSGTNNIGGWMGDDGTFKDFESMDECIMHIAKTLSTTYKEVVGGRLENVCERYCPDEGYTEALMEIMISRKEAIDERINSYGDYLN